MTVHRDKFIVNKTTDALNSSFIGITNLHVSGRISAHHQEFLAVHRHWYIFADLMTVCYEEQDGTAADVRLRTPDDA